MAMPNHLVTLRHGKSEGNFVQQQHKRGDDTYLTDAYRSRPGHEWRLVPEGEEEARAAGIWIAKNIIEAFDLTDLNGQTGFGRYMFSPHRRCWETAGHAGLPNAAWRMNRQLRERDWGQLAGLTQKEHKEKYPENYEWKQKDPLYWTPIGGESVSLVADTRMRGVYDTLHRDHDEKGVDSVILSTHGEVKWANRLNLGYMLNEEFQDYDHPVFPKINNGQVDHWTRTSPFTGEQSPYLRWFRTVCPWKDPNDTGTWHEIERPIFSNEDLLAQVESFPRLFDELQDPGYAE